MKNGTFIIIEKEGRFLAAVRRDDGQVIPLEGLEVTPELQKLDGQRCQYLLKGDKIVNVAGRNIFQQQKQEVDHPIPATKPVATDWRRDLRAETANNEPEVFEDMGKPNLSDCFQLSKARVPRDTRQDISLKLAQVDNFSLKLDRFARFDWHKDGQKFYFFNPKKIEEGPKDNKTLKLEAFEVKANFGNLFSQESQLSDRLKNSAEALFPTNANLIISKFKPDWRFVTGLGGHSVYETGITLHHVYGIPYIPASSVKGVLRAWIIANQFENNEGIAISTSEEFCFLFGCPAQLAVEKETYDSILETAHQGNVSFFDAFPTHSPNIEPDIMNPHYPDYYSKKSAPTDTQNPIPVFFLSVVNTTFQFLIGSKKWNLTSQLFWGKTLETWLDEALFEKGIGAKTAVGYGYMKPA